MPLDQKEKAMAPHRMYWAMRTTRDDEKSRDFIKQELWNGRLRQGWGSDDKLDLRVIHKAWDDGVPLDKDQVDASRHWRMANGNPGVYMNVDDVVLVPNMPDDGAFTLCRVCGDYDYGPDELDDFRHIRPVEVLTPLGVANEHELVSKELRRSLRCRSRLWNVTAHSACIKQILSSDRSPEDLCQGSTPVGRAQSIVSDAVVEPIRVMAQRLGNSLPQKLYGAEWEQAVGLALESLFSATVNHTGGPKEQGADLEVVISNPFVVEEEHDWIIPIQVKDHQGIESADVVDQLEEAFESRNRDGRRTVIAVVLLVTEAEASKELQEMLNRLSKDKGVPFLYCGRTDFMSVLAKGFLRRM